MSENRYNSHTKPISEDKIKEQKLRSNAGYNRYSKALE